MHDRTHANTDTHTPIHQDKTKPFDMYGMHALALFTNARGVLLNVTCWVSDKCRTALLMPSREHRPSTTPRHRTLFWAALVIPDQLLPCCFSSASVSRLQLLRGRPLFLFPCGFQLSPLSLSLSLSQSPPLSPVSLPSPSRSGLGVWCWMLAVSDPAPLPPQYLLGHRFLSRSLPQIFISDLLLPLDFVAEPHTGAEECLDLSLNRLCCLSAVEQD